MDAPIPSYVDRHPQAHGKTLWCVDCGEDCAAAMLDWGQHCPTCAQWWRENPPPGDPTLAEIEAAIRSASFRSLAPDERRIVYAVVDWVRLCAQEGYPEAGTRVAGSWPSHADADHSWLLNRLLQGVPPLPQGDPRAKGLWAHGLPDEE